MNRPRIGISMDTGTPDENKKTYELNAHYPEAILRAGGLPLLLPHTDDAAVRLEYLGMIDALMIPGGDDCDPKMYHRAKDPKTQLMDPARQSFDLGMLDLAAERKLPTLGVCLGYQLMNVTRGGTLFQSIADQFPESTVNHAKVSGANATNSSFHGLTLRPDTLLSHLYRTQSVETNSRHRQAVDTLGKGLIASAFAPDGILEAFEDPAMPFWVGVQWHPENLSGTLHERLFAGLVEAARAHQSAPTSAALPK